MKTFSMFAILCGDDTIESYLLRGENLFSTKAEAQADIEDVDAMIIAEGEVPVKTEIVEVKISVA